MTAQQEAKNLRTAGALIDKALSTSFGTEKEALALRAYRELASYLNSVEHDDGQMPRRRERRLLQDRRVGRDTEPDRNEPGDGRRPAAFARSAYRSSGMAASGRHLDITL